MGKKTRKTRWRTLAIADESDSEESNTLSGSQYSKNYHHRPFYSKFTHSSQSTPTRRFPYEPKSTRSSSTASENKITFNEDEYTKITTPRQDVLFKKGYLSKPKNYQTQTSTGNSTASTGNSTGNGTPDHQSADGTEGTDLEYESQFVFPNAFVDQNGIYYINSYEHYPMVLYNPPICYPEYPVSRTKRHSTGSLTESTSPHTEETSQDLSQSGGENTGNGQEFNHVYNIIYPGYYFNGACSSNVTTNSQAATEPRKIKKKRRRKLSKSVNQEDTTSSEDGYSSDEAITQVENRNQNITTCNSVTNSKTCSKLDTHDVAENIETEKNLILIDNSETLEDTKKQHDVNHECQVDRLEIDNNSSSENANRSILNNDQLSEAELSGKLTEGSKNDEDLYKLTSTKDLDKETIEIESRSQSHEISPKSFIEDTDTQDIVPENCTDNLKHPTEESKFNLNAQEFVPRAYRSVEPISVDPNLQFINIHPNFVPLSLINHPLNELNPPPFNQPFLPPGIPLNFMTTEPKLLPNFVNLVPNHFIQTKHYEQSLNSAQSKIKDSTRQDEELKTKANEVKTTDTDEIKMETKVDVPNEEKDEIEKPKSKIYKNDVDIAKIVSKLEEAAKEQKYYENKRQDFRSPNKFIKPKQKYNNPYQCEYKQDIYRSSGDKRRLRRFDNKSNESTEFKQKETATTTEETIKSSERLLKKSEEIQTESQMKSEVKEVTTSANEEERKYSPRHQNHTNQNSPRRYINYNRNNKNRIQDMSYSAPTVNYSDTLKKSHNKSCPRFEKYSSERTNNTTKQTSVKKNYEPAKEAVKTINTSNQWISVSSRKKRKNKSANEDEIENIRDDAIEDLEVFEKTIDSPSQASQSEIISSPENHIDTEKKNLCENLSSSIKVESFIEMVTNSELPPMKHSTIDMVDSQVLLQDIKDIEEELLKNSVKVPSAQNEITKNISEIQCNESPHFQTKIQKEMIKKKRKGVGKNSTKRIIILDPDISKNEPLKKEKKTKPNLEKTTSEEAKPKAIMKEASQEESEVLPKKPSVDLTIDRPIDSSLDLKEHMSDNNDSTLPEIPTENISTPDKKKNKKKKKQPKIGLSTGVSSVSSSSTTLNNIDDSYDFMLDTTALVEEKTNVEVSEELDKMIQKGLFGNLEEKFKSLNVSVDNNFFKSLTLKPKSQSTPEKGFIKATNFTTILNHVGQSLAKTTSDDQSKIDLDLSKIQLPNYEPQPSTSKTGDFLEKPTPEDTGPPRQTEMKQDTKSNGKLKNKSKKHLSENELNNAITLKENNSTCQFFLQNNDESILAEFIEKSEENEFVLKNNSEEIEKKMRNEDEIVDNEITNFSKPNIEISPAEVHSDSMNDETNIEIGIKKEFEMTCLKDTIIQTNTLGKTKIVIKDGDIESTNSCSLESTLAKPNDITKIERESIKDNQRELFLKSEDCSKNCSKLSPNMKPLYPITQAVKEWMTKTRETTPEIEILKSPDTIYKEFIEHSEEEEDDSDTETNQKNDKGNPSFIEYLDQNEICHISMSARVAESNSENDVTVCETWSMSQDTSIQDDDLLDCWESDIAETKKEEPSGKNEPIEEGEDVLEVYESKYGKSEDFLRLKAEMEEHRKNDPFPKHSNLPYRAICCSLM